MTETSLVGCPICCGRKVMTGLGCLEVDCHHCRGIGWIEKSNEDYEDKLLSSEKEQANEIISTINFDVPTDVEVTLDTATEKENKKGKSKLFKAKK